MQRNTHRISSLVQCSNNRGRRRGQSCPNDLRDKRRHTRQLTFLPHNVHSDGLDCFRRTAAWYSVTSSCVRRRELSPAAACELARALANSPASRQGTTVSPLIIICRLVSTGDTGGVCLYFASIPALRAEGLGTPVLCSPSGGLVLRSKCHFAVVCLPCKSVE